MIPVFKTLSPVEAAVVQSRLEAAQLHASLENELTNIMFGFSVAPGLINSDAGAIHVVVPDEEAAAAREILNVGPPADEAANPVAPPLA